MVLFQTCRVRLMRPNARHNLPGAIGGPEAGLLLQHRAGARLETWSTAGYLQSLALASRFRLAGAVRPGRAAGERLKLAGAGARAPSEFIHAGLGLRWTAREGNCFGGWVAGSVGSGIPRGDACPAPRAKKRRGPDCSGSRRG